MDSKKNSRVDTLSTVETINSKIREKINIIGDAFAIMRGINDVIQAKISGKKGKKATSASTLLSWVNIESLQNRLQECENNYDMSIANILSSHYNGVDETKKFHRAVMSENIVANLNDIANQGKTAGNSILSALQLKIFDTVTKNELVSKCGYAILKLSNSISINIAIELERKNWEVCKCGSRFAIVPELSEMHCSNPNCNKTKIITGTVFRDDQFYPQEGQRAKHGGYDTSRHYRFWIERLQAIEPKTFDDKVMTRAEYVLNRDQYNRKTLSCLQIRVILKDPYVNATYLNDHAPRLVVKFGGMAPPQLSFQEDKVISARFAQAMILYDEVNPSGGNKPYYPYFIYKIIEHYFKGNAEKLRLLDYIHLQSRETVAKNDGYYREMEKLAGADDGIVYTPTDPCGRM